MVGLVFGAPLKASGASLGSRQRPAVTTAGKCAAFQSVGDHGFLPSSVDPLQRLPFPEYDSWEDAILELPQRVVAAGNGELRSWLLHLPPFPLAPLGLEAANHQPLDVLQDLHVDQLRDLQWRAYTVLSFAAHAFLWCDGTLGEPPPAVLPRSLAAPWRSVAAALDMPPVLTYACYNLLNWRRLDATQPVQLGNIVCLANFLGGVDEEWFRLVHIDIEATAAPVISSLPAIQEALSMHAGELEPPREGLRAIAEALRRMQATLSRMGEKCDPYVYYHRVRRPMSGWKGNPELPDGLVYEGSGDGKPLQCYGETGAQSAILHALDAVLGVSHAEGGWLSSYLLEMRRHMPPVHRAFLSALEQGPSLRDAALAAPSLRGDYNAAVTELERFRAQHKAFAYSYIAKHAQRGKEVGTGGTEFMTALAGFQVATANHLLL